MSFKLTPLRGLLLLGAINIIAITVIGYGLGVTSPATEVAKLRVTSSERLASEIGQVKSARLALWGYGKKPGYAKSEVTVTLLVLGAKAEKKITLQLEGNDESWVVVKTSTPL